MATRMKSPCCKQGSIESPCTLLISTILSDTATMTGSVIKKPAEKLRKAERAPAIATEPGISGNSSSQESNLCSKAKLMKTRVAAGEETRVAAGEEEQPDRFFLTFVIIRPRNSFKIPIFTFVDVKLANFRPCIIYFF